MPDSYADLEPLGRGGMGVVYKARDLRLNRTVALKFLESTNPEDARRFQREGQIAAGLAHPHIVPIHEIGEIDGRHYIAMEYIAGQPVGRLRLDARRAAEIIRDAAFAVHYAHGKGVIHRDLSPGNMLMDYSGHVWVMDFGLARQTEPGSTLTVSQTIMGTPSYMSPEQAEGKRCDVRSDVYSLGATLYQLLTGQPPFDGETPLQILDRVRFQDPPPMRRAPPALATITLKALSKDPARRYETARDLAEDLDRHLQGKTIQARPPSAAYRVAKFVKRHKVLTTVAIMTVAFAVFLSIRAQKNVAERNRRLSEGARALSEERWADAEGHWKFLEGDPDLERKIRLAQFMDRAVRASAAAEEARGKIDPTSELAPYELASTKERRWENERRNEELRREAESRDLEAEQAALGALGADEKFEPARRFLAELYLRRGRPDQAVRYGAKNLDRPGTLAIAGVKTAHLFRYEERRRRLIPLPCNGVDVHEVDLRNVDALSWEAPEDVKRSTREGTAYPLVANLVTFPITLKPGSYLVLIGDVRVPVRIEPGASVSLEVRIVESPKGFVYIPAGEFIAGGDPEAVDRILRPAPRRVAKLGDYFISRFAVTVREYAEFLNDRSWHDADRALARRPRADPGRYYWPFSEPIHPTWHDDEPIVAVSWDDASEYAQWFGEKRGLKARLPEVDEVEKAARGVDGRAFPWGDRFDASFAATSESRPSFESARLSPSERIGLFPADESPYGVRDLAGVACTWTGTRLDEGRGSVLCKGGDWQGTSAWSRSAGRHPYSPHATVTCVGLRLVVELP